jgi:lysophospholipase L1-like esterase
MDGITSRLRTSRLRTSRLRTSRLRTSRLRTSRLRTSWLGRRAILVAVAAASICAALALPASSSSASAARFHSRPVVAGSGYLALGDSITFGYREPDTTPPPDFLDAATFVGYPEDVGAAFGLEVTNAACPGETTGSFIAVTAQSNGCEHSASGGPGYRTAFPLHVDYTGSQLAFAVGFLKTHPGTRLVSLMLGANDASICKATTADGCLSEFPTVLRRIQTNVTTILKAIRVEAGYRGQIVILNYYSRNYANPLSNLASEGLNRAQDAAAKPFDVEIANGYGAFRLAAAHSGNSTCKAGLLTQLTGAATGSCGVHPSVAGQSVLAQAVEEAFTK